MKSYFRTLISLAVIHWLTSAGVVLTTASAVLFLILVLQPVENPYFGIVVFLILPALFILGLLLMPVGVLLASRRYGGFRGVLARVPEEAPRAARLAWAFAFATVVNAGILGLAAYHGVGYMDSAQFCGQACHSVMTPQYVRYQYSPHARVPCVDCHIGSGATSFIQYKMAGVRQMFRLATDSYARPVPPAMDTMRPASETCEHCHSAQSIQEDKLKVIRHYDNDEQSTEKITVLLMRVGSKIHKTHLAADIEYVAAGPDRQEIPVVTARGKTYSVEGATANGPSRRMDCMDCHNRAAHDFESPEAAVDQAIASGRFDRSRPFSRRDAVAALKGETAIESQPPPIQMIHSANVFPDLNVTWGTYPNQAGHERFPGCFRCHDGEHVTATGESISQDCANCHEMIAVEEQDPDILKTLGIQAP